MQGGKKQVVIIVVLIVVIIAVIGLIWMRTGDGAKAPKMSRSQDRENLIGGGATEGAQPGQPAQGPPGTGGAGGRK